MELEVLKGFYKYTSEETATPREQSKFCVDHLRSVLEYAVQAKDLIEKQAANKSGFAEVSTKPAKKRSTRSSK